MAEVIELHKPPAHLDENHEFVSDCCRFAEKILTEAQVKKKWRFDAATWEKLGSDDALIEKVELEKVRRIRDGSSKREKAQLLVVQAPDIAAKIMMDDQANNRHRLDAAQTLDRLAATTPESTPAGDRFQIVINLGADSDGRPIVEKFDKSISISADDAPPAAITAAKPKDDEQW